MKELVAEIQEAFSFRLLLIIWVSVTGVVSYSGPFGTYMALDLPSRIVYWGAVVAASIIFGCGMRLLVERSYPNAHRVAKSLAHAALLSAVLAPFLYHANRLFLHQYDAYTPSLQILGLTIFFVSMAVSSIRHLWQTAQTPAPREETRLLQRIEPQMRGRILRLCAGDHSVDVYTEHGATKLRMRFSDALSELSEGQGMQVHRSHWVARDAIAGHLMDKGRMFLKLEDGALVPVSRNYRAQVEESGVLRG